MTETTTEAVHIVALVGSLRTASINRQLAEVARRSAPSGVVVSIVEGLGELPFYNEDRDPGTPEGDGEVVHTGVAALRAQVGAADAVLMVTPEYNGTIPAVLKNAIDWLSRPYGAGALSAKPVGVVGAALGRFGGEWSRADARKSVGVAGGRVVEDVEIGVKTAQLDERGVEHPEIVAQVVDAVARLASEVSVSA